MKQTKDLRVITIATPISLIIVTKAKAADDDEYTYKLAKRGGEMKTSVGIQQTPQAACRGLPGERALVLIVCVASY